MSSRGSQWLGHWPAPPTLPASLRIIGCTALRARSRTPHRAVGLPAGTQCVYRVGFLPCRRFKPPRKGGRSVQQTARPPASRFLSGCKEDRMILRVSPSLVDGHRTFIETGRRLTPGGHLQGHTIRCGSRAATTVAPSAGTMHVRRQAGNAGLRSRGRSPWLARPATLSPVVRALQGVALVRARQATPR
jgi:hypothetical protein